MLSYRFVSCGSTPASTQDHTCVHVHIVHVQEGFTTQCSLARMYTLLEISSEIVEPEILLLYEIMNNILINIFKSRV
jgi:hypothetical protein